MREREPSRTALAAAAFRAAHQSVDGGAIFADPLARTMLGADADAVIAKVRAADPARTGMRIFMAARSRFAEDGLARAVARGVCQAVVLGAGLDTFALRNPWRQQGLQVFEVDHPATQAWKRRRLAAMGLPVPASLTFAAVDFETQALPRALGEAGFEAHRPAFFHWLGVVPYLAREAILATLRFVAGVPGAEVVFDYSEPLERYAEPRRTAVAQAATRAAARGEPWITYFDPAEIATELRGLGFEEQEDLGAAEIAARYLARPMPQAGGGAGPHLLRARRATGVVPG